MISEPREFRVELSSDRNWLGCVGKDQDVVETGASVFQ